MLPYPLSLYKIFLANQPTIEPASANASSARQIACIRTRGMPYYTLCIPMRKCRRVKVELLFVWILAKLKNTSPE